MITINYTNLSCALIAMFELQMEKIDSCIMKPLLLQKRSRNVFLYYIFYCFELTYSNAICNNNNSIKNIN